VGKITHPRIQDITEYQRVTDAKKIELTVCRLTGNQKRMIRRE
jgi:hypothetical protein